jgi:hypothetical protein
MGLGPRLVLDSSNKMFEFFGWRKLINHLPHLSGLQFTAATYCQARARLPLRCFDLLLERFSSAVQRSALDDGRRHGHRPFLVEGSGGSMPATPALQDAFGQPTVQRPGCGVPVARLLGLFHAGTGVLLKLVVAPLLTHDRARVQVVHPALHPGDALVADRGLCSYAHRGVDREPCPSPSGGAARQETTAQELPLDAQTPAGTAPAVGPARDHKLTYLKVTGLRGNIRESP